MKAISRAKRSLPKKAYYFHSHDLEHARTGGCSYCKTSKKKRCHSASEIYHK
jgi:hypothetical protein